MEKLLPYFERELGLLRRAGQEFAARYPKLAGSLQISGETCADPHVERLLQGVAFMNARVVKLLDDGHAGFTEALLQILYPHYLRPFPSCSIARIDYSGAKPNEISDIVTLPRGTEMKSRGQSGAICRFRTAYDVTVAPLAISAACFEPLFSAPPSLRLPPELGSAICITLDGTSSAHGLDLPELATLRVFIDGEASVCAALRDALFMHSACAMVEAGGHWRRLDRLPIAAAGFDEHDALLPASASDHGAYRLLSEYYAFPEKFNFFDIDLRALRTSGCSRLTLYLALKGLRSESPMARLLRSVTHTNLLLACTPVINLFPHQATPIRITHTRSSYPLLPDGLLWAAAEIYSIDSVRLLRKTEQGSRETEFFPYYSLRHGEAHSRKGNYWLMRCDEELAAGRNAHEYTLSLVERDLSRLPLDGSTASIELTCTNRDMPQTLRHGAPGGDMAAEMATGGFPIRLLRRPTRSHRIGSDGGAHWSLIRHLALSHRSLTQEGLPALAAMLRLYMRQDDAVSQRQIDGITGLSHASARAWLRQREGAAWLRGVEVRITLDDEAFAGSGIHVFAQLLETFLALHVHLNSFTQLVVLSHSSGKELLRCPPRNGSLTLA